MMTNLRRVLAVLLLAAVPSVAFAQDPCAAAPTPFTVTSGAPFNVTFLWASMVPASATDSTLVPNRINGLRVQIDGGVKQEMAGFIQIGTCPVGTPFAGMLVYTARSPSGAAKGTHTATFTPWSYAVDAAGNLVSSAEEGTAVTVPFVADDLVMIRIGPPPAIVNPIIKK